MKEHPRKFQLDNNLYERPNDQWMCGARAAGLPCSTGPDAHGRCGAVCQPVKEGDRYYCASATKHSGNCDTGPTADGRCCCLPAQCIPKEAKDPISGEKIWRSTRGVCPRGPLPDGKCCRLLEQCSPVRSVMARRRYITLSAFAGALGLVLIMIAIPGPKKAISPGPLSQTHASLITNCSACHDHKHSGFVSSLYPDIDGEEGSPESVHPTEGDQSERCLHCHQDFHENGLNYHNAPPATLASLHEKQLRLNEDTKDNIPAGNTLIKRFASRKHQRACAECHQEHRGPEFDLKAMTDIQCQSCHSNRFDSFDSGHPEFTNYPHDKRANIYFDHATHFSTHFADHARITGTESVFMNRFDPMNTASACKSCHVPDSGGLMKTKGFEDSCAECHQQQIQLPLARLDLFAVPHWVYATDGEDLTTKLRHPTAQHDWGFSPLVMILLEDDPEFVESLSELESLRDGTAVDESDRLVAGPVTTIKDSLANAFELLQTADQTSRAGALAPAPDEASDNDQEEDSSVIAGGLPKVFSNYLDPDELQRLTNQFPHDRFDEFVAGLQNARPNFASSSNAPSSPWTLHDSDGLFTLTYNASGHADPFLTAWLDSLAHIAYDVSGQTIAGSPPATPRQVVPDGSLQRLRQALFEQSASSLAPGRCTKCHTMEATESGHGEMHWKTASNAIEKRRGFERFSHLPHLTRQLTCDSCHTLSINQGFRFSKAEFLVDQNLKPNLNPHQAFSIGMGPVSIANCIQCHHTGGDNQSCTTCHNYHVLDHE